MVYKGKARAVLLGFKRLWLGSKVMPLMAMMKQGGDPVE